MNSRHIWKVNYKCNHRHHSHHSRMVPATIAPWSPPSDHKTVNGETETNNPLNTTQYSVELATNLRKSFTISEKAPTGSFSWMKLPTSN